MDVSRNQEHDHTHLRDLLTAVTSGLVSQLSGGSETGGGFRIPQGFGHVTRCNANEIHTTNHKNSQAYP